MNLTNKKIISSVLMAVGLVLTFGGLLPALISAPSTLAVSSGAALLIILAVGAAILVRNLLGLNKGE